MASSLFGSSGGAGLAAQGLGCSQQGFRQRAAQQQAYNPFYSSPERKPVKKELTIKEELQADTDKWLEDIKF